MYSPYDNYMEETDQTNDTGNSWDGMDKYFTPGKLSTAMTAGVFGLGTLGTAALLSRRAYNNTMRNNPGFASTLNKFRNTDIYKSGVNPLRQWRDFVPTGRKLNGMDDFLSLKFGGGKPGFKMAGERYGIRMPMMMPLMFGMGVLSEQAINNHPSAIATGIAKTSLSLAGGGVGSVVGGAIGSMIMPVAGTFIGSVAGGAIGSMVGDSVIDVARWIKQKGRMWTHPELGGRFSDSQMGYTMRQRSLNAISTSQFNVRANLGNEASHLAIGY